jgi:transposase
MSNKSKIPSGFTDRQQRLLVEMVRTPDTQAAAKAAGVGRSTVYRWLQNPAFADELVQRRNHVLNEALESVKTLTGRAARELGALLDTPDERLRRHVCRDILTHSVKVRELEEIEQRLTRLEQAMHCEKKGAANERK